MKWGFGLQWKDVRRDKPGVIISGSQIQKRSETWRSVNRKRRNSGNISKSSSNGVDTSRKGLTSLRLPCAVPSLSWMERPSYSSSYSVEPMHFPGHSSSSLEGALSTGQWNPHLLPREWRSLQDGRVLCIIIDSHRHLPPLMFSVFSG